MELFLQPYFLVFELPLIAVLLYALLMFTGIVGGGADLDVEFDADVDIDIDADLADSGFAGFRGFLGIGKVPIAFVLIALLGSFGVVGLTANFFLEDRIAVDPWKWFAVSFGVASVVSLLGTGLVAQVIARIAPTMENYAVSNEAFIGKLAEVRFEVTETAGTITTRDPGGNFVQFQARTRPGEGPYPSGSNVKLLGVTGPNTFLVGANTDALTK